MDFSETVIAVSVILCVVIVLDILFKHALWPSTLDLDIMLVWLLWFYIESSIKVHFSEVLIAVNVKPCIVIVLDILFKHALWPGALHLDFMLEWLCCDFTSSYIESSIKVCFSEEVIAASVKPSLVIFLDILFKHSPWPGAFDLDFILLWLCHYFTSNLALKCVSLKQS